MDERAAPLIVTVEQLNQWRRENIERGVAIGLALGVALVTVAVNLGELIAWLTS